MGTRVEMKLHLTTTALIAPLLNATLAFANVPPLPQSGQLTCSCPPQCVSVLGWADAIGDTTQYSFNDLNQLSGVSYPDSSTVNFTYDKAGNIRTAFNSDATVGFGYDEMNRVSAATQSVLSVSSVVGYSYDKNGNRTGLALPGIESVTYTYDDGNRLSGLSSTLFGSSFTFTYNDANELTGITYPNGVTANYTRDDGGRVTGITYADGGTTLASRTYTYNALGQITKRTITAGLEAVPSDTHRHMRHNSADQLTHVSRMDNYETPETWRDVGPHYDPNGATTNMAVKYNGMNLTSTFSWDYNGRLESYNGEHQTNLWFTVPPLPANLSWKYDALGGRITRYGATGGEKTHVLDQAATLKNVLVQTSTNGTIERYYIYAPGFGLVAHVEANGTVVYYHGDHLGSTIALTDSNGNVTDEFAYTPYGELMSHTGTTETPYTFCGRHGAYWEGGSLYHMKARYYRADIARFISSDPIGISGGVNLYAYANGNPILFLDALGLCGVVIHNQIPNITGGNIAASFDKYHQWIETSEYISGLGAGHGVPGENGQSTPDLPGSPTYVVDHTGRESAFSTRVTGVDIEVLNTYLEPGQRVGSWLPILSDCNTFVDAIGNSTPRPRIIPVQSQPGETVYQGIPTHLDFDVPLVIDSSGNYRLPGSLSKE